VPLPDPAVPSDPDAPRDAPAEPPADAPAPPPDASDGEPDDDADDAEAFDPAEWGGGEATPLMDLADVPAGHRSGYVALVGAPNAGKSTLLNRFVGTKLAIVSPRPSTTRNRVLGILSAPGYQLILLDTPGVVRPKYRLHEHMLRDVDRSLADADLALFLADATAAAPSRDARDALDRVAGRPALLVLTKTDLLGDVAAAIPVAEQYLALRPFEAVVPISAETGYNLDALLEETLARIPEGPPFYPKDQLSEHPERFFVAEIVRESVFNQFRDEVPYAVTVNVVQYEARQDRPDFIACDIVVERDSQKAILIGKGGQALKKLGTEARRAIEAFVDRPVYLKLFVKTRPDWRDREGFLREYGYGKG
jgi:GTP-binding protein Era